MLQGTYTYEGLEFRHFVVAKTEGIIFASARQAGRVINFLLDLDGEWVKHQVKRHFEYLPNELASFIREKANLKYGILPVYRAKKLDFDFRQLIHTLLI